MIKTIVTCSILFVLIAFIGFFSSSETAFLSLTKIKVREMLRTKKTNAKLVAKLYNNIESLLTLVLVGTNFVNSLSTSIATMLAVSLVGDSGVGIATIVIAFFVTTFGQIIPKTFAVINPETPARTFAPILEFLRIIFFPIILVFSSISKKVVELADKVWKDDAENSLGAITTEELQTLFDVGEREGTLDKTETDMLGRVFEFSDLRVHDIMRHRSFIRGVKQNATYRDVVCAFDSSGYSQLVVYDDASENIVGVIDYKEVLFEDKANVSSDDGTECYAVKVMRQPLFVPETFTPFELLEKFYGNKTNFSVVLDEQGSTAGIATIVDVMRVVFDRMIDDNLVANLPPEERIKIINEKEYIVPGDMKISDANEIFNFSLDSEEFNTIGGWLLEQFGSLPHAGEVLKYGSALFIVEDQSQRRIKSIKIRKN